MIAQSCKVTANKKYVEQNLLFRDSPKRTSLLKQVVAPCIQVKNGREVILDLCETRWSKRQES